MQILLEEETVCSNTIINTRLILGKDGSVRAELIKVEYFIYSENRR